MKTKQTQKSLNATARAFAGNIRPYKYTVFASNNAGDVMCKEHAHDMKEAQIQAEGLREAHGYTTVITPGVFWMISTLMLIADASDSLGNKTSIKIRLSNDAQAKRWMGLMARAWPYQLMKLDGFRVFDTGLNHGIESMKLVASVSAKTAFEKYGNFSTYNPARFKAEAYANFLAYKEREAKLVAERKAIETEFHFAGKQ